MAQPLTILVVDDIATNRKLLRAMLEAEEHRIIEAVDGVEALALLGQESVDAVISDILMPRMDGYRLCHEVRQSKRFGAVPFIFYSSTYTSPSDEKLALDLGGDLFLQKPAPASVIIKALGRLTAQSRPVRPQPKAGMPESEVMREYSDRLVAKLEEKNTELMAAQEKLILQASALRAAANAILITDHAGRIIWINPAFTTMTGYTAEETIGKTPRLLKSGKHDAAFYHDFWKTISSGQTWCGEFTNRRKDGSLSYDEHTVTPVRNADGKITNYIGIMHDVTARKQVEEDLRATHAQLCQLLEHSPAVIYALRVEGQNVVPYLVSDNMERLLGVAGKDTSFEWWQQSLHPEDRERAMATLKNALQGDGSSSEYRIRHKDGTYRWVQDNNRVIRDAAGQPKEIVGVWTDFTERRRTEEALRASEEEFRASFYNAAVGKAQTDPLTGQYLRVNRKFCEITGYSEDELKRMNFRDLTHPDDREADITAHQRMIRGNVATIHREKRYLRKDGGIVWVNISSSLVRDASGRPLRTLADVQDITEQRKLEQQFRQSQKMESIGQLAGGIAHDFNNILGAVMGYTELAQMEAEGNPVLTEYLGAVQQANKRAMELVKQILTFSRRREQERKPTSLKPVVEEVLKLLRASVPASIQFQTDLADAPAVLADTSAVHQVVMNLGTNAWHAMRDKPGTLKIGLSKMEVDADYARAHPDLRPGRYVRLSVSDSGCGMGRATLERVFEPFFTTKAPGEGTGLGLSVVHGIMKSHDGGISVYSQPGEGTTFNLYFPVFETEAAETASVTKPIPLGHGEHILFLDDELPLVVLGKTMLERLGYRVTTRINALEAIAAFREQPDQFHLVITDLTMPVMNGANFARQLLQIRPGIPIILSTGYSATMTSENVREMGFRELLIKPNTARTLGEAVHRVLSQSAPPERPTAI